MRHHWHKPILGPQKPADASVTVQKIGNVASLAALANMTQLRTLIVLLCCHKDCMRSFTDDLLEAVSGEGLVFCACYQIRQILAKEIAS